MANCNRCGSDTETPLWSTAVSSFWAGASAYNLTRDLLRHPELCAARLKARGIVKADPFQIGDVLKNPKRFVVPIHQRTYVWKIKPHLETFFDQVEAKAVERLASNGSFPHYMGALLVIPRSTYSFSRMEVVDVVESQQRLTTFEIFLAALRELARSLGQIQIASLLEPLLLNTKGPQMQDKKTERYKFYPDALLSQGTKPRGDIATYLLPDTTPG
jgi:Protein of unknown function DUF262